MAKVLPSINCHYRDTQAVAARVREVEGIFKEAGTPPGEQAAHFDVADGAFTFHKSWDEPEILAEIKPAFAFEAHLMVEDPRPAAERWLKAGAKRIIVHQEAASPTLFEEIALLARKAGGEAVLALNPETSAAAVSPYLKSTSSFLVLGVHPGISGQKFLPTVLEKISFLRKEVPDATIEIDGGMNIDTARVALAAGADALVSGSNIFDSPDPEAEYEKLRSL